MFRAFIVFIFTNIFILTAHTAPVRFYGSAPDYKGMAIEINKYADFITHELLPVCVLEIDSLGNFDITADIETVTYAFADLGAMRAYIYIEPEKDYELVLPPFTPRADVDRLNPYFQPELIEMGIASTTSRLNEALRNFYVYADSIYNASAIRIVKQRNRKLADKIIADYDSVAHLQQCNDDFFNDFVRYQQAKIFTLARLKSPKKVAEKYFLHDSVAFNQEAYWQTLDLVYGNFLSMTLKGKASAMVREVLAKPSPHFSELSAAVASDSSFLDATQLREMLVVKGIYDAYYSGTLSPTATDTLLYSTVAEAVTETARIAANNILVRLNRMRVGTLAPDFTLYDFEGVERKLSDFKGLFVYLSFQHSKNFASQKDFPALQVINKKYERLMYVVNIFTDENVDEAKTLVARGKYNWLPLSFINDQAVVLRYGITHEPSYFLIDPDGRLSLSPAPSPTEERLVTAIAQQMQKYKTEKMRRTPPKIRDIYDMVREVK